MASKILNASVKTSFSQINKLKFFKINIESKLLTWHSRLRFQAPIQALPWLRPYTPLHLLSLEHCLCSLWNTEPHPNWIHLLCTFLCSQGSLCLDRVSLSLSLCPCYDILPLFKAQCKHLSWSHPWFRAPHAAPSSLVTLPMIRRHTLRSSPTRFGIFCLMLFPAVVNSPLREKPYFPAFCLLRGA